MKVTVEFAMSQHHPTIIEALEKTGEYKYLGKDPKSRVPGMMFEAVDTLSKDDAIKHAKAAIKTIPNGKTWFVHVILTEDRYYMPR